LRVCDTPLAGINVTFGRLGFSCVVIDMLDLQQYAAFFSLS
jgi:hypothetical protein